MILCIITAVMAVIGFFWSLVGYLGSTFLGDMFGEVSY